jgi:phosphopantothenate-cysteine ligase
MKTIVITAGPVSETIDPVRKITNGATGKLGALTAEAIHRMTRPEDMRIVYVCERGTILPEIDDFAAFHFSGTTELSLLMKNLLMKEKPDAVIHSMAVSDYRVEKATGFSNGEEIPVLRYAKIPSGFERLTLELVQTPKIIKLVREYAPETFLVGFKLLDSVPLETLLEAANRIMVSAECDLVLANDAKAIQGDRHTGFLVKPDRSYERIDGKHAIAETLARSVLGAIGYGKE